MLRKAFMVAALFSLTIDTQASAQTDAERVAGLEAQVRALTAQVELLKSQNETLLSQIAGIRGILGVAPEPLDAAYPSRQDSELIYCLERLDDVRRTKDRLVSAGFREGHPDMLRLTAQLQDISTECDAIEQSQGR